MRMWMVDPTIMCRKHLMGEHVECHMLVGSLQRNRSIKKFLEYQLVDPSMVLQRHNELANEMLRRGYNHKSPLPTDFDASIKGIISPTESYNELLHRCPVCAKNIKEQNHVN